METPSEFAVLAKCLKLSPEEEKGRDDSAAPQEVIPDSGRSPLFDEQHLAIGGKWPKSMRDDDLERVARLA